MKYLNQTFTMMIAGLLAIVTLPAQAQVEGQEQDKEMKRDKAYEMHDQAMNKEKAGWIRLIGTVEQPDSNSFQLNIGETTLTVRMDDLERHTAAHGDIAGDSVVVAGPVDAALFTEETLHANEIHFSNLQTHLGAMNAGMERGMDRAENMRADRANERANNRANENAREDDDMPWENAGDEAMKTETAEGTIMSVDEASEQFTLDTGEEQLVVKTSELDYDPFAGSEESRVDIGDQVVVTGQMVDGDLGDEHLEARRIVFSTG